MSKLIQKISLFLSSPGGLNEERNLIQAVCEQITYDLGKHHDFVIEVLRWEHNTRPAAGISAQDTINKQMGLDYDIYLGMLGTRFGTPTQSWGSGTEEEFELAYESWSRHKHPEIMFYFAESTDSISSIDPEDLRKRLDFKRKIEERGILHGWFFNRADLEHKLRKHLTEVILSLLADNSRTLPQEIKQENVLNPLENWSQLLVDDPVVHIEDLLVSGSEKLKQATDCLGLYSDRTERAGRSLKKDTKNFQYALNRNDPISIKSHLETMLVSISSYSHFLKGIIPQLAQALFDALSDFSRAVVMVRTELPDEIEAFAEFRKTLNVACTGSDLARAEIIKMSTAVEGWPDNIPAIGQQKKILKALSLDLSELIQRSIVTMQSISSELETA